MTGLRRSLPFDEYYVGWVCPLVNEQVAARAVLDEIHDDATGLGTTLNDENVYTLGRIGKLNVVIAGLPEKAQGSGAAARVASDMVRTYYRIKVVLLVGTGGGVPGFKIEGVAGDIRLGDVVVCDASKQSNAVIQYDSGKALQGGVFQPTGWQLDKPPERIRGAISKYQVGSIFGEHDIAHSIEDLIEWYPALKSYARPSEEIRAFRADYVHQNKDQACTECCSFTDANLLQQDARDFPEEVVVHYGSIGSAALVVRDSSLRDRLAREQNIICFEMEAAGMMDGFPCLVIRGISNYADSHKNDTWERYAALAAAVYAHAIVLRMNWQSMMEPDPISNTWAATLKSLKAERRKMKEPRV
ncbi:hypothetical protein TWF696_003012 [Orbilia brochopaga]|uniref:Nucleoside phosphorylase domain-containing protein n=1 Tax=Orbilia brochopaga TaxID=3140254 RepID=A0AAV9TZ91_9PEZI